MSREDVNSKARPSFAGGDPRTHAFFGKLSSEASVLGAGSIAVEKHFEIPALKPRFMIESLVKPAGRRPQMEAAPQRV
jgi:hypothetical protein